MRVVLDLNILVSAILTPAPGQQAREVYRRAVARYTVLLSDFMLARLNAVLHYERLTTTNPQLTEDVVQEYLTKLRDAAEIIAERTEITPDEGSNDSEDNRVMAAAIDGNADYVVTRNITHFPKTFHGVKVISPEVFLDLLRHDESEL